MQEKIIKRNIIIAVVVTLLLVIGMVAAWGTLLVKPQAKEIAETEGKYTERKQVADDLPKELENLKKAEDQRAYVEGQLAFFQHRYRSLYFGDISNTDPNVQQAARETTWRRWMNEFYTGYGIALRDELVNAANATGVTINTAVKVVAPPRAPEEVAAFASGLYKPTGGPLNVTITGSLSNILQFFNRINQSSILLLIDRNIRLEGYSPDIKVTFSLTPYLLAAGPGAKSGFGGAAPATPAGTTTGTMNGAPAATPIPGSTSGP